LVLQDLQVLLVLQASRELRDLLVSRVPPVPQVFPGLLVLQDLPVLLVLQVPPAPPVRRVLQASKEFKDHRV